MSNHRALTAFAFVLAIAAVSAAATSCSDPSQHAVPSAQLYARWFTAFRAEFGKLYTSAEEVASRYATFKDNIDLILAHQRNPDRSFDMEVNQFADLTNDEFRASRNGLNPLRLRSNRRVNTFSSEVVEALPASVNWTAQGKVTPVKDQGQCGSCWAFSTTGATESAYAIENNDAPISLSEQELVDCSSDQGNDGCAGGLMDQAFRFIEANKGLCSESAYKYLAVDGSCAKDKCSSVVTISDFKDVPHNNEQQLQAAVAQQPVSVAVDASELFWQFYSSGVVPASDCGTQLDHGVLATGYGSLNGKAYWLVKNSWGESWGGLGGYIMLARTNSTSSPGTCGIAMQASYPTGAKKALFVSEDEAAVN